MVNRVRLNSSFGPRRKGYKPLKMKPGSKIMQKCLKEVKTTRQHYMDVPQDKAKPQNPIIVKRPWPEHLKQPSSCWLNKPESRASSIKPINGLSTFSKNDHKSSALPRPNNDSLMSKEDPPSLGLNNDAIHVAKISKDSWETRRLNIGSSRHKNIENPMPSSSRLKNGAMSLAKSVEILKVSSSQNNGAMPASKNAEKSKPLLSRHNNDVIGMKNTEKSRLSLHIDKVPLGKFAKPTYVEPKDSFNSPVSGPNSSSVRKFSTNKDLVTSKGKTTVDNIMYTRVDLSPTEAAIGDQVHKEELSSHRLIEESSKHCISLDSKRQNISLVDNGITIDDGLKRKRRMELLVENPEIHEDDGKEVVFSMSSKKQRKIIDISDDDRSVSESFVSERAKLQYYSLLPIDKHIWSGICKIGSKYVSMAAHLSPKACKKVWELSKLLKSVVKVTKLPRLEAFPMGSAALKPTHDNIALYFLPHEMRPNDDMDQLVKELIENDMVLLAVVREAEMLILPSILLPEQHKTFKSKHYLWGVFRPRKNNVALMEEHRGADCFAREEVMEKQDVSHQQIEKEPSSSLAESDAVNPAEVAACPTSAFTSAAAVSANHVQSNSILGVPSGAVFGFVAGDTPRFKELIQELKQDGAVVIAMQGATIE